MTTNWRRKRRIRARTAKTGESHAAALRHLQRAEEAQKGELAAVADGLGGHNRGEVASRLAMEAVKEAFSADPTAEGLLDAVRAANRIVWERAEADVELHGMGTTIAAAARVMVGGEQRLVVVNVGDSRAYRLGGGELGRLSSEHSLVGELVRAGELTEADARAHPDRHVLSQALGVAPEIEPHVADADLARGDRLLLWSDGLFNELADDEIPPSWARSPSRTQPPTGSSSPPRSTAAATTSPRSSWTSADRRHGSRGSVLRHVGPVAAERQVGADHGQDVVRPVDDVVVGEPEHPVPRRAQPGVALRIGLALAAGGVRPVA